MTHSYFWLSDQQFDRLAPLLPQDTRGKPRVDDRRVISGIVHVLKSGCRWVDAPEVYGPRKTLYNLALILEYYNLFGASYLPQAKRMIERLAAELRG